MGANTRRILKELEDMSKDTQSGINVSAIDSSNMMHLQGRFMGPPGTPYEGGEYLVDIVLEQNYPFVPPRMKFETKVWHPNVSSQTGAICLDTLSAKWTPVLTIKTALLSLQSLLDAPEPNDPQDNEVAQMMIHQPAAFKAKAREWAIRFAGSPPDGAGGSGGIQSEARRKEEARRREYDGYSEEIVDGFAGMGFPIEKIVNALKSSGIARGRRVSEEESARVVEVLLS